MASVCVCVRICDMHQNIQTVNDWNVVSCNGCKFSRGVISLCYFQLTDSTVVASMRGRFRLGSGAGEDAAEIRSLTAAAVVDTGTAAAAGSKNLASVLNFNILSSSDLETWSSLQLSCDQSHES